MQSEERPSIWDLRSFLLSSLDFAEDFANNCPEHAAAVTRYSQEIRRIKEELMITLQDDSYPSSLHDVLNGIIGARAMAPIIAERHPEKTGPLTKFVENLKRAQEEFIGKVRPDVDPPTRTPV